MFKYISAEVAPLFAKTLKVRFTQPSDLNDPFELRPLIDFNSTAEEFRSEVDARITEIFGSVDGVLTAIERQQATDPNYPALAVPVQVFRKMIETNPTLGQQFMAEMQRHKAEILQRNTRAAVWETQWQKFQESFGQSLGIFSLTEDPVHTLMWSHYASQHYGVVVEFDENNPWFDQRVSTSDDFRHLVRVTYVQNPQPRTWQQLQGADVLYTKNAEWAYEREWRIIRPVKDGTEVSPGKFCFEVPADAVSSIIFGCRTTPALETGIRAIVKTNLTLSHVSFKRTKLLGGGKLELVDVT
jgi:Protein of unknown function (DUF2971)